MLLEKVQRTIARYGMLNPEEKVVIAVSGGPDSMVLLHLLRRLQEPFHLHLHVAHLNHGLRGEEGERDATFVKSWAEKWGLPSTIGRIEVRRTKGSLQEAARHARYRFLEEVAKGVGASRIALGHTQDDLAETVLINLLRGAGLKGLAGIPPARERWIIRPLIEVSRREILAYAESEGVPFVVDASNLREEYLRNRIRQKLLPTLAEYNPRIVEALARAALILREEDAYLSALANEALSTLLLMGDQEADLPVPALERLHPALSRRILREAFFRISGLSLSWEKTLALEGLLRALSGRLTLPGGVAALREGERLVFSRKGGSQGVEVVYRLSKTDEAKLPAFGLRLYFTLLPKETWDPKTTSPFCAFFDAEKMKGPLTVRAWRPGDRFFPLGLGGSKKLQDFFVDLKIPRWRRPSIPLLFSGDQIAWVVGLRIDDRFKVTEETQEVLKVEAFPLEVSS
ncbi:MAG: tRNA lysidine(34) synthetase TilS [Candidatus Methylomirabilales bacterium]